MSKQFVSYICEITLDQTKLLVGKKCMNQANFQDSTGFLVCHDCLAILDKNPERITLPKPPFGMIHQINQTMQAIRKIS